MKTIFNSFYLLILIIGISSPLWATLSSANCEAFGSPPRKIYDSENPLTFESIKQTPKKDRYSNNQLYKIIYEIKGFRCRGGDAISSTENLDQLEIDCCQRCKNVETYLKENGRPHACEEKFVESPAQTSIKTTHSAPTLKQPLKTLEPIQTIDTPKSIDLNASIPEQSPPPLKKVLKNSPPKTTPNLFLKHLFQLEYDFSLTENTPVHILLMVDTSGSMESWHKFIESFAYDFKAKLSVMKNIELKIVTLDNFDFLTDSKKDSSDNYLTSLHHAKNWLSNLPQESLNFVIFAGDGYDDDSEYTSGSREKTLSEKYIKQFNSNVLEIFSRPSNQLLFLRTASDSYEEKVMRDGKRYDKNLRFYYESRSEYYTNSEIIADAFHTNDLKRKNLYFLDVGIMKDIHFENNNYVTDPKKVIRILESNLFPKKSSQ